MNGGEMTHRSTLRGSCKRVMGLGVGHSLHVPLDSLRDAGPPYNRL